MVTGSKFCLCCAALTTLLLVSSLLPLSRPSTTSSNTMEHLFSHVEPTFFAAMGKRMIRCGRKTYQSDETFSTITSRRYFLSYFGTTPWVCSFLWAMLKPFETMPRGVKPCHLLWALMFMKVYATETVHAGIAGCDEKTFRKWSWLFVKGISQLETCFVSVCLCMFCLNLSCFHSIDHRPVLGLSSSLDVGRRSSVNGHRRLSVISCCSHLSSCCHLLFLVYHRLSPSRSFGAIASLVPWLVTSALSP